MPVAGLRVTLISSGRSVWRIFRLVLAALCCWNHNLGFALLLGALLLVEPLAFAFLIGFLLLSLEWKAHRRLSVFTQVRPTLFLLARLVVYEAALR